MSLRDENRFAFAKVSGEVFQQSQVCIFLFKRFCIVHLQLHFILDVLVWSIFIILSGHMKKITSIYQLDIINLGKFPGTVGEILVGDDDGFIGVVVCLGCHGLLDGIDTDIAVIAFGLYNNFVQAFPHDQIRTVVFCLLRGPDGEIAVVVKPCPAVSFKLLTAHMIDISRPYLQISCKKQKCGDDGSHNCQCQ